MKCGWTRCGRGWLGAALAWWLIAGGGPWCPAGWVFTPEGRWEKIPDTLPGQTAVEAAESGSSRTNAAARAPITLDPSGSPAPDLSGTGIFKPLLAEVKAPAAAEPASEAPAPLGQRLRAVLDQKILIVLGAAALWLAGLGIYLVQRRRAWPSGHRRHRSQRSRSSTPSRPAVPAQPAAVTTAQPAASGNVRAASPAAAGSPVPSAAGRTAASGTSSDPAKRKRRRRRSHRRSTVVYFYG